MIEKPILFSGPMVRAILEGRKTMTRRIVKQPNEMGVQGAPVSVAPYNTVAPERGLAYYWKSGGSWNSSQPIKLAYEVGDVCWVRESHAIVGTTDPGFVLYRADGYEAECRRHGFDNPPPESSVRWRPSIHMPRWACRIRLRVTAVKVERLNSISEEDAMAEGAEPIYGCHLPGHDPAPYWWGFSSLWSSIHGPGSWDANPFVAAYSFERVA